MDVDVDPTRPEHRRVQTLLPVRCEHHDPLLRAARAPQTVVDVVAEEVGHGGHEAGLPGAGGSVQQVASLPNAAQSVVVLFGFEEGFEVGFDLGFEIGFHGDGLEGGRVSQRDRSPPSISMIMMMMIMTVIIEVHVQLQIPSSLLDLISYGTNMLKIRFQDSPLIGLAYHEDQVSTIDSLALVLVHPDEFGPEKMVLDSLVGVEPEDDLVGPFPGDEVGEIRVLNRSQRIEIFGDLSIELILLHGVLVDFRDLERLVDMEAIFDHSPPFLNDMNQPSSVQERTNHHHYRNDKTQKKNQV
ncbi:hypothetical protein PanWU01x14_040870 [Parasponia andersonii]|uniref:Uncharacterized protein n=1 Tax=Parasponia andersonii TaxID=3476 RepID=A0A2P5DQ81_PARAD|nr:hypothetical protein PanWU01x14_040870 [Parasponia andersonii]